MGPCTLFTMILPRFKALLLLFAAIAPALANFHDAGVLARDTAPPSQYAFDVNAGAESLGVRAKGHAVLIDGPRSAVRTRGFDVRRSARPRVRLNDQGEGCFGWNTVGLRTAARRRWGALLGSTSGRVLRFYRIYAMPYDREAGGNLCFV